LRIKPVGGPALMLVVGIGAGCIAHDELDAESAGDETIVETDGSDETDDDAGVETTAATCGDPNAYTPYATTELPTGDVTALPWRGKTSSYPSGLEAFDVYATGTSIECGSTKATRTYLDVTSGCLTALELSSGAYHRAQVTLTDSAAFRALALGYSNGALVKWTGQRSEYRFYYTGATGTGANPGFKVFARYRSEDDLYVASWRLDGVVQIQKKQCGVYTILARTTQPAPTTRAWHRIRFDANGNKLALYLDDRLALSAEDNSFSWGTSGIRIDGVSGVYLDDWRVF
jgi:hypothetical protein